MFKLQQSGVASLPTILVLIMLIISVGVLVSSVGLSDSLSVSSMNDSRRALDFAKSGARDALERMVRDKDYFGTYSLEFVADGCEGDFAGCASVSVSDLLPKTIVSEGRVGDFKRKIQVVVDMDGDGLISGHHWQEF